MESQSQPGWSPSVSAAFLVSRVQGEPGEPGPKGGLGSPGPRGETVRPALVTRRCLSAGTCGGWGGLGGDLVLGQPSSSQTRFAKERRPITAPPVTGDVAESGET